MWILATDSRFETWFWRLESVVRKFPNRRNGEMKMVFLVTICYICSWLFLASINSNNTPKGVVYTFFLLMSAITFGVATFGAVAMFGAIR